MFVSYLPIFDDPIVLSRLVVGTVADDEYTMIELNAAAFRLHINTWIYCVRFDELCVLRYLIDRAEMMYDRRRLRPISVLALRRRPSMPPRRPSADRQSPNRRRRPDSSWSDIVDSQNALCRMDNRAIAHHSLIGIEWLRIDTVIILYIVECLIHQTTTASVIAVRRRTVDKILFR